MWLRSQNKKILINANNIRIISDSHSYDIISDFYDGEYYYLGEYSTEEKALKVMDMIEDRIRLSEMFKLHIYEPLNITDQFVFQLPKDDVVEV